MVETTFFLVVAVVVTFFLVVNAFAVERAVDTLVAAVFVLVETVVFSDVRTSVDVKVLATRKRQAISVSFHH